MDYLENDNGRTIATEQTLHIYYTIRFRPRPAHPMEALRQMCGWLEAWHNFYSLKKDKTCMDKIEELQAIVQYVTNPTIKLDKRKIASDQNSGASVGRALNTDLSGSERASADTLMADESLFEPQIPQKVAGHTSAAPMNSQQVGVVTGGVPNPQRAENRFQDIYPLPPGYMNLEDPFGKIHKIVVDEWLQCVSS